MGIEMKRCNKCGRMDYFPNGVCSKCGFIDGAKEEAFRINTSQISEGTSEFALSQKRENYYRETIDDPKVWMYIVSIFIPILQWIFMGVYVSKNDSSSAFKLFMIPFVFQVIATIIIIAVGDF